MVEGPAVDHYVYKITSPSGGPCRLGSTLDTLMQRSPAKVI